MEPVTVKQQRDFETLRGEIIARRDTLPKRLTQVAEFTLRSPDEVALGTVASIAEQAGVQPSTLIRFAQAFGFSGFSELQELFRSRLKDRWPDYSARLKAAETADDESGISGLLHRFAESSVNSIVGVQHALDVKLVERAVDLLAAADTVHVLGLRRAFPVATYLHYSLAKLGVKSVLVDQVGGLAGEQAAFATARDALVAISFTPYTPATVEITSAAHELGVPVVAITDSPFSPLAPKSAVWLEVAEADFAGFRSLAASMTLALALAVAVAERRR